MSIDAGSCTPPLDIEAELCLLAATGAIGGWPTTGPGGVASWLWPVSVAAGCTQPVQRREVCGGGIRHVWRNQ